MLAQEHADGIGLLAGGAAQHPHPQLVARALALEQLGHDLPLQQPELRSVTEELGDPDQQVLEQVADFLAVGAQELDVPLDLVDLLHLHPPPDAAQEGVVLVAMEVVAGLVAQDRRDPREVLGGLVGQLRGRTAVLGQVADIGRDPLCDLGGGQREIDQPAGVDGVILLIAAVRFGDGQAAVLLERGDAGDPVRPHAAQDHGDGALVLAFRQGDQEAVDRSPLAGRLV